MVDELQTIREATTEVDLRRVYAVWMAGHTGAYAWELRGARDAFHDRRRRLRLLQAQMPESVDAPASVTTWLGDWAEPGVSSQALAARLPELAQDLTRGRGRGSYEALLAARDQWLQLLRKPGLSEEHLALLGRRITTPGPEAREIEWAPGPDARALARAIRDDYPLVLECERAFFRPHLAPPALPSDLAQARKRKRLTGPAFRSVWAIVLGLVALSTLGRTLHRCSGDGPTRRLIDTTASDRILETMRGLRTPPILSPELSEDLRKERMATLRFAMRTDTAEEEILAHFERHGRTEAKLRDDIHRPGAVGWHGDEALRMLYKSVVERLDTLRAKRGGK